MERTALNHPFRWQNEPKTLLVYTGNYAIYRERTFCQYLVCKELRRFMQRQCLKDLFNVQEIYFQDDTLNINPKWFFTLCDRINQAGLNKNTLFKCPFRANEKLLTKELLKKARSSNFWMIFYGVENGNQQMLDSMRKDIKIFELERAFKLTREAGLAAYASFMIGNSGETNGTVNDSIGLMKRLRPDFGGFAIATPFPGSRFYDEAKTDNHLMIDDYKTYHIGDCIVKTDSLTTDDIVILHSKANNEFDKLQRSSLYGSDNPSRHFRVKEGLYTSEIWDVKVNRTGQAVQFSIPTFGIRPITRLRLTVCADYPDINSNPVTAVFRINGHLHSHTFHDGEWHDIDLRVKNMKSQDQFVAVYWRVSRTWRPSDFEGNDSRDLGLVLQSYWLS